MGDVVHGPQPLYNFRVKAYMGKDRPWREQARTVTYSIFAHDPERLWRELMAVTLKELGVTDARAIVGLILNLCNGLSEKLRETLVLGIIEGMGFAMEADPADPGNYIGRLVQRYDSLNMGGERTTKEGVIIPAGAQK